MSKEPIPVLKGHRRPKATSIKNLKQSVKFLAVNYKHKNEIERAVFRRGIRGLGQFGNFKSNNCKIENNGEKGNRRKKAILTVL